MGGRFRVKGLFFIVASTLAAVTGAFGQPEVSMATLSGVVADQNGAAVVGAKVLAVQAGTGVSTTSMTKADGVFTLFLSDGEYGITVSARGFELLTQKIEVRFGESAERLFTLSILPATAMVTVSDDAGYLASESRTATKTFTPLRDVPQSVTVIGKDQIKDQSLSSISDVVRYVPGVTSHQGENNRDEVIIRGNRSGADFFRDGVRDDVQYYRDLYNLDRLEVLKGPNAMIFGRGGGGGVINRVTKEAGQTPVREFTVTGGSFYNRRFTGDLDQPLGDRAAFRLNGVYENSKSFRDYVGLDRFGVNPTFAFSPDEKTNIHVGYEYFRDRRVADRGMTSYLGHPVDLPISTFYGDPDRSKVRSDVNVFAASLERLFGSLIFRNRFHYANYDRFYQNYVPGAANSSGTQVAVTAYNNATQRSNWFDQSDLTYSFDLGRTRHTIVGGTEFGRQITDNFRNTGYFNNSVTTIQVAFADPVTRIPVTFRQTATDADNHLTLNLAAGFVQDQIEISRYVQAIAGVRYDYFDLTYRNNRNSQILERMDHLVSPRLGLVIKPVTAMSIYGSYSVSYLPSSGDQFASLTNITQQVKPEKFTNYEAGVKWDLSPKIAFTSAIYRLDRTNTRANNPSDPTQILQTGSQRTTGFEAGLNGSITNRWTISGGYSWQNARITSTTVAAPAGRRVAQVPRNMFSLWNKYQISRRLGAGLGLSYRSDMYAAIDNTVVLPAYLKADAAVYYNFGEHWRLQANLENLTNKRYFVNADSNTNISPGSPRSLKVGLIARF